MNKINDVRAEIEKHFNQALIISSAHESFESPSQNYSLEVDIYTADDPARNWSIAAAIVTDRHTGEIVAEVKRNDDSFFHCWIERDGIEYLACSEDLEGQTVIDLTHKQVASYCSDDDPFIWSEFYPSPNKSKLAVIGCYWACPYMVIVYDFSEPLSLPLKHLAKVPLIKNNATFDTWINEHTFTLKNAEGTVQIHTIT